MADSIANLPRLTAKQAKFKDAVIAGETLSDAYRSAYDAENMSKDSIYAEASRLASSPKITSWLLRAAAESMDKSVRTLDGYVAVLWKAAHEALRAGNHAAYIRAIELLGKVDGQFVTQFRDVTPKTAAELEQELAELDEELSQHAKKPLKLVSGGDSGQSGGA